MNSQINIFPVDSNPLGISYGEWVVKWWQWLCSMPARSNPAFDKTGEQMYNSQTGSKVLFLCQTVEGVDYDPIRRNQLPESRLFFMPLINWISIAGDDGKDDDEMIQTAKNKMDVINELQITINGINFNKGLEKFRCLSPIFEINLPEKNILGISSGKKNVYRTVIGCLCI